MNTNPVLEEVATAASRDGVLNKFNISSGIILGVTGLAKVGTAFGHVKLLDVADPIVGIHFRQLMVGVGLAEVAVAAICLCGRFRRLSTLLVAWISTNFLVYRIGLWWMGWKKPCGCLGNLTDALHIPPHAADVAIKVLLAYLLVGSYGLLIWQWRSGRGRRASELDGVAAE